jgi:ketosteroid isomerase-like protein
MSSDNLTLFWESTNAFNRAMETGAPEDWEAYLERYVDPSVEYVNAPDAIEPGTRHGHEGMWRVRESWLNVFEWLRGDPDDVVDWGDAVVSSGTVHARGRDSGIDINQRYGQILVFKEGKVIRWETFNDPDQAFRAAGVARAAED